MANYGTTFAFVGFAYSSADCLAETMRGKVFVLISRKMAAHVYLTDLTKSAADGLLVTLHWPRCNCAGKRDALNGMLGGVAAGFMLGLRLGRIRTGVGAAAALAATSLAVDLTGQKLVGDGMVDDGATPKRRLYPYPRPAESQTAPE